MEFGEAKKFKPSLVFPDKNNLLPRGKKK